MSKILQEKQGSKRPAAVARRVARRVPAARSGNGNARVSFIVDDHNRTTAVVIPIEDYERFLKADMARVAVQRLENTPDADWIDAGDFALEVAAEQIVAARERAGLTQKQLGKKLGLPQSMISRIERNPDRTTVRTLKRVAKALGVRVSTLI